MAPETKQEFTATKDRKTTVGSLTILLDRPGSDVDEMLWGNGPFIAIRNERDRMVQKTRLYLKRHPALLN
jgi:hypothetical protein